MTPERLAEIEALAKAATPGPWFFAPVMELDETGCMRKPTNLGWVSTDPKVDYLTVVERAWDGDALYIATVHPSTVLDLIAYVRELEAALREIADRRTFCSGSPFCEDKPEGRHDPEMCAVAMARAALAPLEQEEKE